MKLKRFVIALLVIAVVVIAFCYKMYSPCCEKKEEQSMPSVVSLNEARDLFNLEEKIDILPASGEHKIIHVFTTWCSCCKGEGPELEKISKDYDVTGLVWSKNAEDAKKWLDENGNHYTKVGIINDDEIVMLGISKTPMTLVLDHDGNVRCGFKGAITKEKFDSEITQRCLSNQVQVHQ